MRVLTKEEEQVVDAVVSHLDGLTLEAVELILTAVQGILIRLRVAMETEMRFRSRGWRYP